MKNFTFTLAFVLSIGSIFGQTKTDFGQIILGSPFIQTNDTLFISGIAPDEVKIELADYSCNVKVETQTQIINEKEFSDEQNLFLLKEISIAEAIEEKSKIYSKLDRFREKNVQIGGKTPIIERTVVLTVKKNTVIVYEN